MVGGDESRDDNLTSETDGRKRMTPSKILAEIRRLSVQGDDAESDLGDEPAPTGTLTQLSLYGWALALGLVISGFLLSLWIQGRLVEILALPATVTDASANGFFIAWLVWILIVFEAKIACARQWLAVAAISIAYFVVVAVVWPPVAAILFRLAPKQDFTVVMAILPGMLAALVGWTTFYIIHRLLGRASPWRKSPDVGQGGLK